MNQTLFPIIASLLFFAITLPSEAMDYIKLKKGQVIQGIILRQDTTAVIVTDWESRHLKQPPLEVYGKEEVESIWFDMPPPLSKHTGSFIPHTNGVEYGGNFSFQTWQENNLTRRYLGQISLSGGYSIIPEFGMQGEASITLPYAESGDSWDSYNPAYHVTVDLVANPVVWNGIVPYIFAGGGAALGIPFSGVTLTGASDLRSLIDTGIGVKWGANGIGYKVEIKHHYYTWTPDETNNYGIRSAELTADATQIKFGIFLYR